MERATSDRRSFSIDTKHRNQQFFFHNTSQPCAAVVLHADPMVGEEDDTITSPRDPNTLFNFGPASSRDNILFTCERPGGDLESGTIPSIAVEEWAHFMKEQEIDHVLVLLDDHELACYDDPSLLALYDQHGLNVHRTPMGERGSSTRALQIISKIHAKNQRIVAHCTHGQGRAGRVAAAWLTYRYTLTPEDATTEVLAMAYQMGVTRMGSASKLRVWLNDEDV